MKRGLLIAGGTVGGIGAVLSITPPQLSSDGGLGLSSASAVTSLPANNSASSNSTSTNQSATSTSATNSNTNSNSANVSKNSKSVASPAPSKAANKPTATPKATNSNNNQSTTSSAKSSVNGTFTGDAIDVGYGLVQVRITVSNGKISEATAVQAPSGRSQRFTDYAVPNLRQQTLSANSAAIQGVSGASYTSYGWYKSLITALQKAGMATGV